MFESSDQTFASTLEEPSEIEARINKLRKSRVGYAIMAVLFGALVLTFTFIILSRVKFEVSPRYLGIMISLCFTQFFLFVAYAIIAAVSHCEIRILMAAKKLSEAQSDS